MPAWQQVYVSSIPCVSLAMTAITAVTGDRWGTGSWVEMAFERTLVRGPERARTHQPRVGPETAAFTVRVQRNFSFTLAEVLGDSSNSSPRAPAQRTAQAQAGWRSAAHTPLRPQQLMHMLNLSASPQPQMLTQRAQSTGRRGEGGAGAVVGQGTWIKVWERQQ